MEWQGLVDKEYGMKGTVSCATVAKTTTSGRVDLAQALTGVVLALFTLMHAVFLSTVIISPYLMDGLGWLLEVTYIAQIGAPLIFLIMIAHFLLAARKLPVRLGELPVFYDHAKRMRHSDTWLWLVQAITAIIILVLVSIHIYTMMMNLPITAESSAMREQNGWTPFYLILLICVGLHLGIGLFRVGVKFGFINAEKRAFWAKCTWLLIGAYVALGVLTIIRFHYIAI